MTCQEAELYIEKNNGVVLVAADAACGVHGFDGAAQCVVAGLRA